MDGKTILKKELLKGEEILWQGQPETKAIFSSGDILLIPFSVLWSWLVFQWEFDLVMASSPFALLGVPIVFMALYALFGRFIYKNSDKKRTLYVVTNQRLIQIRLSNLLYRDLKVKLISQTPNIQKKIRSGGIGTLLFDRPTLDSTVFGNSGMPLIHGRHNEKHNVFAFYDIPNAEVVYKIVSDLKS